MKSLVLLAAFLLSVCGTLESIDRRIATAPDWELCFLAYGAQGIVVRDRASNAVAAKAVDFRPHMAYVQARVAASNASDQQSMQMLMLGSQMMNTPPAPAPGTPITCQRRVVGGAVQTVCR
jgi:hypothetical protein